MGMQKGSPTFNRDFKYINYIVLNISVYPDGSDFPWFVASMATL